MSLDINAVEVICLIQQFLAENNLNKSLKALQEETNITMNTVESIDKFVKHINTGKWDLVLRATFNLSLPERKLADLYEQIAIELMEIGELAAARSFIRKTDPLEYLRNHMPERYAHLEKLLTFTVFDEAEAYPNGINKKKRRQMIAESLSKELKVIPPSRLIKIIGQYLNDEFKDKEVSNGVYDLLQGELCSKKIEADAIISECYSQIKFPKNQAVNCISFSPNGEYLVTGSSDGFIEVWDYIIGKLHDGLAYQAQDNLMLMEGGVLSLAFSRDGGYIASGDNLGKIKIWKFSTGTCIQKFLTAHTQGVSCLCFNHEGSKIISGGLDHCIRLHGPRSGRTLKEFRGHESFINDILFCETSQRIISASSDGTTKIWNSETSDCLATLKFNEGILDNMCSTCKSVIQVLPHPHIPEAYIICDKSEYIYTITASGKFIESSKLKSTMRDGTTDLSPSTMCVDLSSSGEYIHVAREDGYLYTYYFKQKTLAHYTMISNGLLYIARHKSANILAVVSDRRIVSLWRS